MAGKSRMIRGLTCFTAAASLVLATVPAYGAEVTTPPAPQSPTSIESASTDGVNTPDPSQDANDVADSSGNDGLEIQDSGSETATPPRQRLLLLRRRKAPFKFHTLDQRFYRILCLQVITNR